MSEELHHPKYVRIWGILLVLLAISVAGPFLGIGFVTLITHIHFRFHALTHLYLVFDISQQPPKHLLIQCLWFLLPGGLLHLQPQA